MPLQTCGFHFEGWEEILSGLVMAGDKWVQPLHKTLYRTPELGCVANAQVGKDIEAGHNGYADYPTKRGWVLYRPIGIKTLTPKPLFRVRMPLSESDEEYSGGAGPAAPSACLKHGA